MDPMTSLALEFWPGLQYQVCFPSLRVGLQPNQEEVGCFQSRHATMPAAG